MGALIPLKLKESRDLKYLYIQIWSRITRRKTLPERKLIHMLIQFLERAAVNDTLKIEKNPEARLSKLQEKFPGKCFM